MLVEIKLMVMFERKRIKPLFQANIPRVVLKKRNSIWLYVLRRHWMKVGNYKFMLIVNQRYVYEEAVIAYIIRILSVHT